MPTAQDWLDRDILDGAPAMDFGNTPVPGQNPFGWPGFATCNQAFADPDDLPSQINCSGTFTFPNGEHFGQTMAVADAWRALALGVTSCRGPS